MANNLFWAAITRETFTKLSELNITGAEYKIFFYLCSQMDSETNIAKETQASINDKLGTSKATASTAMKKLMFRDLIVFVRSGFMINPSLIYINKPKPYERVRLREKYSEARKSFFETVKGHNFQEKYGKIDYLNFNEDIREFDSNEDE